MDFTKVYSLPDVQSMYMTVRKVTESAVKPKRLFLRIEFNAL